MARDYPDSFAPEPIDRVAARVISGGTHHEFVKTDDDKQVWEIPPEVVPLYLVPLTIRQLFGTRKGSLLVVGYLGRPKTKSGNQKGQKLLVRCDCGRYEVRIAKKWRCATTGQDYCQFCTKREKLKVAHLSHAEKDRLFDLKRTRAGLPSQAEIAISANKRRKEHTERLLDALVIGRKA